MGVVAGMEVGGREGMADLLCEMCPRCKVCTLLRYYRICSESLG